MDFNGAFAGNDRGMGARRNPHLEVNALRAGRAARNPN